jgi:hypothetical protein
MRRILLFTALLLPVIASAAPGPLGSANPEERSANVRTSCCVLRTSTEATPEIQALRAEQETALANHDVARFKELECQIQELNPGHCQPQPVDGAPVPSGPPKVADGLGPGSDIPVDPGLVYGTAADYEIDGTM